MEYVIAHIFGVLYDFLCWIEVEKITFIVQSLPLCSVIEKWQCISKNVTFSTYNLPNLAHEFTKVMPITCSIIQYKF